METYTLWVGGSEVNDRYLSASEAINLAFEWALKGYDDIQIERIK